MGNIWISPSEIAALPTSGAAWDKLKSTALGSWGTADINNSTYTHNIGTLGGALYAARTNDLATRNKTETALRAIIGTEVGGQEGGQQPSLAVSRKLCSYVVAADILNFREPAFVAWIDLVRFKDLQDGRSVREVHEERINNWGTMAFASRVAAALYLSDTTDLNKAIHLFKGWLGDYVNGYDWNKTLTSPDMHWQADKAHPVGINKKGATLAINGAARNVDGVLPDDQRRTEFTWPAPKGNYPHGGIGPILVGVEMLRRAGIDTRAWSDSAVLRAERWLVDVNQNPPQGDDSWQPHLWQFLYSGSFPGGTVSNGKNFGFTAWTHAGRKAGVVPPTDPPPPPSDCSAQKTALEAALTALPVATTRLSSAQNASNAAHTALVAAEADLDAAEEALQVAEDRVVAAQKALDDCQNPNLP